MNTDTNQDTGLASKTMDDHTLPWLIELLKMRLSEMGPRDKTLNLKLCKAGAKKLLANLEGNSADASDVFLATPPKT
jgi:hypothetical protein